MGLYPPKPAQQFEPCPPGLQLAICCDVIDLGIVKEAYQGQGERLVPKIRIVWQSERAMRDGKPYLVQKRYTFSVHEKSNLRKDCSSWRGRSFTDDEIAKFDFEKLVGVMAMINVVQSAKKGTLYSDVVAIMKVPKGTRPLTIRDYVRHKDREKGTGTGPAPARTAPPLPVQTVAEAARPSNFDPPEEDPFDLPPDEDAPGSADHDDDIPF
jgi:hypothetical protein